MPAMSWSDADGYLAPAPAWRFTVTFPDIPNSDVSGQTLSFLVERFSAPHKSIEYEQASCAASARNFPVSRSVGQLHIVLAETILYDVAIAFRKWADMVIDDNGNFGLPKDYKKQISLAPLDETGANSVTFSWQDCSPTTLDNYEYDGSQSVHVQAVLVMMVDHPNPITAANQGLIPTS